MNWNDTSKRKKSKTEMENMQKQELFCVREEGKELYIVSP